MAEAFTKASYARLLSLGTIPGEDRIDPELLSALAALISRNVDAYVSPEMCAGPAALVMLACDVLHE